MAAGAVRRWRQRDDGAVAVEFALTVPIFLMLLFGVTALGFLVWTLINANGAARESARLAAVGEACGDANSGWIGDTISRATIAPMALTAADRSYNPSTPTVGGTVTVTLWFTTVNPDRGAFAAATTAYGAGVLLPETFKVTAQSRVEVVSDPCTYGTPPP